MNTTELERAYYFRKCTRRAIHFDVIADIKNKFTVVKKF